MSADAAMLEDVPLFSLLDGQERFTLAGMFELRCLPAGHRLFDMGDTGDSLYIVRAGKVRCFVESNVGETLILGELGPGELVGEISLLDGGPRTSSAETIEPVELLVIDRASLLEVIARHPHVALDLLTVMGCRLRASSELLRERVTRNPNVEHETLLTFGERVADRVASFGGSWTFIFLFGLVLMTWMTINYVRNERAFDPYPFILLNLVLSTLAALQAPIIMMSQNRQAAKDRLKADLDFDVNLKAELEVAQLHVKIDRLYESLQAHLADLERAAQRPGAPGTAHEARRHPASSPQEPTDSGE
jgi:uncharacterized membrane protein